MRVLILHDRVSERGGSDRYLLSVLELLQDRAETLLVVAQDDGSLADEERQGLGRWVRVKGLDRRGIRERGLKATLGRLEKVVTGFEPDIIHIHNVLDPEVMALAADFGATVMTVQDHRVFCPGQGKLKPNDLPCGQVMGPDCMACFRDPDYGRRIIDLTARRLELAARMRRVVVLSRYMADELAAAGLDPERISVIPPFVHRIQPRPGEEDSQYHLLPTRLVRRKGVLVALEAAARLERELPLIICGDGPLSNRVAAAAEESNGRLRYLGWVDREGMSGLLSGACSVWLPSLWAEPFGLVGLEAMACSRPVIASNVGGVTDWLADGRSGLLVRPGKPAALAKAADSLANNERLAQALGRTGQEIAARQFSRQNFIESLMAVYRAALTPPIVS